MPFLTLPEYQTARIPRGELADHEGMRLYQRYAKQVQVDPPGLADDAWQLTNQGWAGYIPLTRDTGIFLEPRIPLVNLFGMMGYAYQLGEFLDSGLYRSASVREFYEQLAYILARRVLARGRQGFFRKYVPKADSIPYVRGRIDVSQMTKQVSRNPVQSPTIPCDYHEHTANVEDNRILAGTLYTIVRSRLLTPRVAPTVRAAYRVISTALNAGLSGGTSPAPVEAATLAGPTYSRLNQDYRGLHALCRFFLDNSGPQHLAGNQPMIPFLVNMARLFEMFVAAWLREHLPNEVSLRVQERLAIGGEGDLYARVDLVLYERASGRTLAVLDTKYKTPDHPAPEDVFQAAGYADLKGCSEAYLVYPAPLQRPFDARVGAVRVRSVVFGLEGELDQRGTIFLNRLDLGTYFTLR